MEACIRLKKDDPEVMQEQIASYRSAGFDHDDLIESNWMIFNLDDNRTSPCLDVWWREIERYSRRDQLSLNYALKQSGIDWHPLTNRPNSVRNHAAFALVPHDGGVNLTNTLLRALGLPAVDYPEHHDPCSVGQSVDATPKVGPSSRTQETTAVKQSGEDASTFAAVSGRQADGLGSELVDAPEVRLIDPYMGPTYAEVRQQRIAAQRHRRVDIVVCVHDALEDVKSCLSSICSARNSEQQNLIIVDDGSDEPTAEYLYTFARNARWINLHRNEKARGYTKAANQGLIASTAELVVLLNSDAVVTDGWAEKLADAVFSTPGAGIVGPMSGAASHQSIPEHRSSNGQTAINDLPAGLTAEDMNRYCEQWTASHVLPRVPLVHGFCFGVTRNVIDSIGYFDEENFPRGYGEENDYCFRAADAGFGLVIATHTYVFHAKSKSYTDAERVPLMKAGSQALEHLYGRRRIQRAVKSMQSNSILEGLRRRAANVYEIVSRRRLSGTQGF